MLDVFTHFIQRMMDYSNEDKLSLFFLNVNVEYNILLGNIKFSLWNRYQHEDELLQHSSAKCFPFILTNNIIEQLSQH